METLGNDLVLLSIRSNGVIGTAAKLGFGLSGSELVRLTALGQVEVEGGQIVIRDAAPTGDVLLDEALKSMHGGLLARYWIARREDVTRPYLERLVSAGTISLNRRKALGLVSVAGWTVVDAGRLAAARARLDAVAYGSDSADSEQVALAALATAIGLPSLVYPGLAGWSARRRVARAGRDSGSPANLTSAPRTANTTAVWSAVNSVSHAVASASTGAAHHAADHGGHSGGGHH
jgi:hypothetical protein